MLLVRGKVSTGRGVITEARTLVAAIAFHVMRNRASTLRKMLSRHIVNLYGRDAARKCPRKSKFSGPIVISLNRAGGINMKVNYYAALLMGAATCLSGCGTITQGTSQNITITSTPPGAHCDLTRKGEHVATLDKTPGTVKVDKTKNDILLTCDLPGYQTASANLESGYGAGTFGNIILGGGIGWAINSATGADNKYPSTANVQFVPAPTGPSAAAPASSTPATIEAGSLAPS